MATKYLDSEGLLYFWQKIKSLFVADVTYDTSSRKIQKTKAGTASDVVTLAKVGTSGAYSDLSGRPTLATVATSGSYNDLSDTPTIPSGVERTTTTPKMDGTAAVGAETKFAAGDHVHPTDTSRAPNNHATTATTYGKGTSSNYGHVKLSDSTSATTAASSGGTAATPKAVSDALAAAKAYTDTAVTGGATFQGTAPTTFAPTNYKKGWYWVVGTAGTYAGQTCEAGDMIFCITDYGTAYKAADFDVIQTNLDITSITNAEIDTIVA